MNLLDAQNRPAAAEDAPPPNPPGLPGPGPRPRWLRLTMDGLLGTLVLLACLYAGQYLHQFTHVPLSGTVIGLVLLAIALVIVQRSPAARHAARIEPLSRFLITHLGLLFVPAGVGIIVEGPILRAQWLPILAGLLGSTWIGLAATGLVMHRCLARHAKDGDRAQS